MSRPEAINLVEQIREASEALRGIGCTEPLRDVLEQEITALDRPAGKQPPAAFVFQRTLDAYLAAWPESPRDSVIYGLVRTLANYVSANWSGDAAIAQSKTVAGSIERSVRRHVDAAALQPDEVH